MRAQLAKQDSGNAGWQSNLSNSYERVGDILRDQGDLTGALSSQRQSLAIREQLAKQDPRNAGWQGNLAFSYFQERRRLTGLGQAMYTAYT
jgi:eukaryotic-like serine/threonine-protein kinase